MSSLNNFWASAETSATDRSTSARARGGITKSAATPGLVGGGEGGFEEPIGVRRHVGEGLEVVRLEVERHQILALLWARRRRRHERAETRRDLALHLHALLSACNSRIRRGNRRRRWSRLDRLPHQQRPRV